MKVKILLFIAVYAVILGCVQDIPKLKAGPWQLRFHLSGGQVLPVDMEVEKDGSVVFINASERVKMEQPRWAGDSVFIYHPVFEGYFKGELGANTISGVFVKESLDRSVPITMTAGKTARFLSTDSAYWSVEGTWEAVFSPQSEADRYPAMGLFQQDGNQVVGTFRTTTGDYRFLQGVMDGDSLKLSTFDGAHVFLFEARVKDGTMEGVFYSGDHWIEPFTAHLNPQYELTDPNELTALKPGWSTVQFEFPNEHNEMISLADKQFQDKVVVVQLMGSWCPNCLEESRFYAQYYNAHKNPDLEFLALAFEYTPSAEAAWKGLNRLRDKLDITYPILLAQYGTSDKTMAAEKLPMLEHIISYPTTIFIDRNGEVRKIHTGFNGEATGLFDDFQKDFDIYVTGLLNE